MTSQAQAEAPMPGIRGLVSVGFPLHTANKPAVDRAMHLTEVSIPMLFLQGTRDALANLDLMKATVNSLASPAELHVVDGADHAFHVLVRSGRTDADVVQELARRVSQWMSGLKLTQP